jgi:hypothetical protein
LGGELLICDSTQKQTKLQMRICFPREARSRKAEINSAQCLVMIYARAPQHSACTDIHPARAAQPLAAVGILMFAEVDILLDLLAASPWNTN